MANWPLVVENDPAPRQFVTNSVMLDTALTKTVGGPEQASIKMALAGLLF
ncbi:MAG: hypothetical protein ACRDHW_00940 [Ktedonobacteraceae bacterium]